MRGGHWDDDDNAMTTVGGSAAGMELAEETAEPAGVQSVRLSIPEFRRMVLDALARAEGERREGTRMFREKADEDMDGMDAAIEAYERALRDVDAVLEQDAVRAPVRRTVRFPIPVYFFPPHCVRRPRDPVCPGRYRFGVSSSRFPPSPHHDHRLP